MANRAACSNIYLKFIDYISRKFLLFITTLQPRAGIFETDMFESLSFHELSDGVLGFLPVLFKGGVLCQETESTKVMSLVC